MSKLIVEMEMPRSCEFCHMAHWNKLDELTGCDAVRGKRNVPDNDEFWNQGRPSWCPIKGEISEIELMHLEEERAFAARNLSAERKDDDKDD